MTKGKKHIFDTDAEYEQHIAKMKGLEKYLDKGDLTEIAKKMHVTDQYVSNVKCGTGRNNKILNAIINKALENKLIQTQTI